MSASGVGFVLQIRSAQMAELSSATEEAFVERTAQTLESVDTDWHQRVGVDGARQFVRTVLGCARACDVVGDEASARIAALCVLHHVAVPFPPLMRDILAHEGETELERVEAFECACQLGTHRLIRITLNTDISMLRAGNAS